MFGNQTPKILIVEDEPVNHSLYKAAFEKAGFEVTICADAEGDFIERVVDVAPDIISMDLMIGMSGNEARDGFDAIELLKGDDRTKQIPVFVLSNFMQEERITRAQEVGAADYIVVQGQALSEIANHYVRYLKDPKHYKPVHHAFVAE